MHGIDHVVFQRPKVHESAPKGRSLGGAVYEKIYMAWK